MDYIHEHITINGRRLSLDDICTGNDITFTDAEAEACAFIRDWLTGVTVFELQTSGSTGMPKKILFRRDQLAASALASIKALGLVEGETAFVCLATRYVAGKMMLVRALLNQMKIVFVDPGSNPAEKIGPDASLHFAAMVPAQVFRAIEKGMADRLSRIKTLLIGGAAAGKPLRASIRQNITAGVYFSYGMTETLTHIALEYPGDEEGFFTPLSGVRLSLDDRGCLTITADYLDDPVVTNDLVELRDDGRFRFLGRSDNVVNSGGIKVLPEVVEDKIAKIFQRLNIQNRFLIGGMLDERWGETIIMIIEGEDFSPMEMETLRNQFNSELNTPEVPKRVVFLRHFSATPTDKIDRSATLKNALAKVNHEVKKGNL